VKPLATGVELLVRGLGGSMMSHPPYIYRYSQVNTKHGGSAFIWVYIG